MKIIKIANTDIFLDDLGNNKGKITISDTYNHNYSYFWGSMGGTLDEFLCNINSGYFADKLLGTKSNFIFCEKSTFTTVRKFIATELNLPWYKHQEFQKDMREKLNSFQNDCENENHFVGNWSSFIRELDFYLIKDHSEQISLRREFENISEVWNFIGQKLSPEYLWLEKLHGNLKAEIKKQKFTI